MRSVICLSVCMVTLLGCASPKPVAPSAEPALAATNNAKDGFKEALDSSQALPPRGN